MKKDSTIFWKHFKVIAILALICFPLSVVLFFFVSKTVPNLALRVPPLVAMLPVLGYGIFSLHRKVSAGILVGYIFTGVYARIASLFYMFIYAAIFVLLLFLN